ncbi:hypothetical protein DSC45_04495 [Streptomyces sp. YIM 130001]|uniref:hypothetical protein n=1 Tax=Streptomyces sp. YIM 130001 TaxID=2259644 RepID=UPI000E649780|nr:hypothetical protein [Streptomyces sp. YIM 130001]RII20465.1 hypothetical protein DSC45_04495 [Streptomyces sp. YIM 130001]
MESPGSTSWEAAVLAGGPADGLQVRVSDRPRTLQVSYPCQVASPGSDAQVVALHVYRLDWTVKREPLRYGFDGVSP